MGVLMNKRGTICHTLLNTNFATPSIKVLVPVSRQILNFEDKPNLLELIH